MGYPQEDVNVPKYDVRCQLQDEKNLGGLGSPAF